MRSILASALLLVAALSGCVEAQFGPTSSEDSLGNEYEVLVSNGEPPRNGETVVGASAQDLFILAQDMAFRWSDQAELVWVAGVEAVQGAADGSASFMGPVPEYEVHDAVLGDGRAPAWGYLFVSPDEVGPQCDYLFVHAMYNGFAVSYAFDPDTITKPEGRFDHWTCAEGSASQSSARWVSDSDTASDRISDDQDRFATSAITAEMVTWELEPVPDDDPGQNRTFDTAWVVSILQDTGDDATLEGSLACTTPAGEAPGPRTCLDLEEFLDRGGLAGLQGYGDHEPATEVIPPESGEGQVQFAFVFSAPQQDTFTVQEWSHPRLTVNYTVPRGQASGDYQVQLIAPNGTVEDTSSEENNGVKEVGNLSMMAPVAGEWAIKVVGGSGAPQVEYTWCAVGYDLAGNGTVLPCDG